MIRLRITWTYCVAFYCLGMLYISLHELTHHLAGFLICGDWGYKSFNYFSTACEGTRKSWYATLSGPLFTYGVMYVGALFVRNGASAYRRHLGFAMIFAQWPLQRMTSPALRMNDEYVAISELFGYSDQTYWSVLVFIWLICLPPLIVAYRAIENERRWLWFGFYLVLFPYLLIGPVFGGLEYLMVSRGVLDETILGVGMLFILNEIVTITLFVATRRFIDPDHSFSTRNTRVPAR